MTSTTATVARDPTISLLFRGMRYTRKGNGTEEIYDYYRDSGEANNLASSNQYRDILEHIRVDMDPIVDRSAAAATDESFS